MAAVTLLCLHVVLCNFVLVSLQIIAPILMTRFIYLFSVPIDFLH